MNALLCGHMKTLFSSISLVLFISLIGTAPLGVRAQSIESDAQDATISLDAKAADGREPILTDLDGIMKQVIEQLHVPGGALAVAKDGRLVYAKGFGYANIETKEPVKATTRFNLASCTKTVTTLAILTLVKDGRLKLDDNLYNVLGKPKLPKTPDLRMPLITIRQLMHHSGGWSDDTGFVTAGNAARSNFHLDSVPYSDAVPYLLTTPLDYTPGTEAKYSNGQWSLLKFVVEHVSGMSYADYTHKVLASIGIHDMIDEPSQYIAGEAVRYKGNPPEQIQGGMGGRFAMVPTFGIYIASAVDMVKLMTAIDGSRGLNPITPDLYKQMLAPLPLPMVNRKNGTHYGLGLDTVRVERAGAFYTKNGAISGVHAQIEHLANGVDFAIFFNGGTNGDGSSARPLAPALKRLRPALCNMSQWPAEDLFLQYR
jgi:CubicO group peptidase (beta-lactamase class C family)